MDHPEAGAYDDSGMSTYDPEAEIVMGHEYCAEVLDYGPKTQRNLARGTRVSSLPVITTPVGRKIIGQNPDTPGGFGEYFLIDEAAARAVRSDLPSAVVSVSDAIAVGASAAMRAQITSRELPLIIGCGAVGLSAIAWLKRMGVGPVVAVDFVAARRRTALLLGADVVIDPAQTSPFQAWRELAAASVADVQAMLNAAVPALPGCVVFECVGVHGVLDAIIKGCERGARIFSVGGPPEGDHLHTMVAKRKGLNIQFGGGPLPAHWDAAFEAVCSGTLDVSPLLGDSVGLEAVPEALNAARDAHGPMRIVVVPGLPPQGANV
jgi:threonine dehydrogenase-like Zn-dependent dehydrogenase